MRPERIYLTFVALSSMAFVAEATSYSPFMNMIGLSIPLMELVNVAFIAATVIAEVPTGMLADSRSRRWSLCMGAGIGAAGFLSYGFATGFLTAILSEVTIGIGLAFVSGAAQAWVVDAMARAGRTPHDRRRLFMEAAALRALSSVAIGSVGALAAHAWGLRAPWFVSATLMLLALLFAARFFGREGEVSEEERLSEFEALRTSLRMARSDGALRWVLAITCVAGLGAAFNHLWQPYFLVHLTQGELGGIWFFISLGLFAGSYGLRHIHASPQMETRFSIAAAAMIGLGLLGLASVASLPLAILWLIVHEFGRGAIQPLTEAYLHERIESRYRATFGSLHALVREGGIGLAFLLTAVLSIGLSFAASTARFVWLIAGSLLIALALLLLVFRPKNGKA